MAEPAPLSRPSLLSSALATFGTQLLVAILSLVNVLIVARALGPVGRGDVAFLTTIAYLTSQIALLGIGQANVNLGSSEPHTRAALASNSLLLSLVFGTLAAALVAGLIALFPAVGGETTAAQRALPLAAIPMLMLQTHLAFLLRADFAFRLVNAATLLVPVVNVGINLLFLATGLLSVTSAVATWIAGQALATVLIAAHLQLRLAGFGRPDLALARRSLRFGLKAHGGHVMMLGNYKADQWLVGAIAGSRELGLYSIAVAWAESLFYLATAVASVQRPALVRSSVAEAGRQAARALRATLIATLPVALAIIAAAPFLCVTVFGEDFRESIEPLRILTAGAFGVIALKLLGNALTAQGRPLLETTAIAVAFAVTLVLDILLIPPYGAVGAAVASSAAYTAGGVTVAVIFARTFATRLTDLSSPRSDVAALARALRRR
jgi:O-antigen/teichoic acid export membrane protein